MGFFRRSKAKLNLEDFDTAIRLLLAKYAPEGETVVEGDSDSLLVGEARTNLGNLRRRWSELDKSDRLPWLDAAIADMRSTHFENETLDPARLMPGLRSSALLGNAPLRAAASEGHFDEGMRIPSRHFAGNLNWVVVWDTPHSMSLTTNSQIAGWDSDFDSLFATALENYTVEPIADWGVMDGRVYMPAVVDDYLGSQIFLPGGLDKLPFSEERVVFLPTRTAAVIAPASDPEAIKMAAELTKEFAESANPVSLKPLVGSGSQWRPLELDNSHHAFDACHYLEVLDDMYSYESQKELLQEVVGEDMLVASFAALESNGRPLSVSTWTRGVESLLPKSDVVAFVDLEVDNGTPFFVRWSDVRQICGHWLGTTNHSPARWRVVDYPSNAELGQLRSAQAEL